MNNENLTKYAPMGLVISGLALLSLLGFLITSALSDIRLVTLPNDNIISNGLWISALVIVLGLAVTALLNPEGVRKFFTGRQVRYGSNSVILLLAVAGILFFVNALVYENPKTWDVTEDQQNTLAPETIKILESIETPVVARAYYSSQISSESAQKLLEKFKTSGQGKFSYEFINPEFNPVQAEQDKVERDGSIILLMGDRREVVSFASERDLAAGIVRLQNPGERFVYFVTGHGEISIESGGDPSYALVKRSLELKNYTVASLNLLSTGRVPENAGAVVIVGPKRAFSNDEVTFLKTYLEQGGGLIVMKEPPVSADAVAQNDPLDALLADWGIVFNNDLVVDPNVNPPVIAVADPTTYARHPDTQGLLGYYSAFPTTRSLTTLAAPENVNLTPLVSGNLNAWGETDFESLNNNTAKFDEGTDMPGPVTLAVAAEDWTKNARLVVFGDSEMAADAIYQQGNGDIFINAVDWVAEQDNLINLTPKEPTQRSFKAPGTAGFVAMILGALCVLPLLVVGAGVSTWAARRKRG